MVVTGMLMLRLQNRSSQTTGWCQAATSIFYIQSMLAADNHMTPSLKHLETCQQIENYWLLITVYGNFRDMRESERKCSPTKLNTNTKKDREMVTLVKRHYLCVTQASDAWPAVNFIWEDSLILHWWSEMTTCNFFFLNCTHKHLRLPLTSMIKHRHTTTQLIKTQVDTLKSSASKGSLCF